MHSSLSNMNSDCRISKHPRGFLELERQFVLLDGNKTRECTINTVSNCLGIVNVKISNAQLDAIIRRVIKPNSEKVNYLEMINELRGQMNKIREGAVNALFKDIDVDNRGSIGSNELIKWFKPLNIPTSMPNTRLRSQFTLISLTSWICSADSA
jgi:Ca2+-binding EF-hand superfamily protein